MSNKIHDIIRVENLKIVIDLKGGDLDVIRGASFRIPAGRTVALVGESGSGKSIIAQAILGIMPRVARITGGRIMFAEKSGDTPVDLTAMDDDSEERRALRGGKISIIFQEPMTSLSPLHTIGNQVEEALTLHRDVGKGEARKMTCKMFDLVGFPDPQRAYDMYSMELSGGLRQRAMIAMAIICHPALLIADEPTTALDVSMQAKILGQLKELQQKLNMAVLLITHDLGVVANMADEVVVIYHGQIMEAGQVEDIFRNPQHDYLKALLNAVPSLTMSLDNKLQSLRDIDHVIPKSMERNVLPDDSAEMAPLLKVRDLHRTFTIKKSGFLFGSSSRSVTAVSHMNFDVRRGECFGIVGESGCGKTTTIKMIMRALLPDSGEIIYNDGKEDCDILSLEGLPLKQFRKKMQMVFQDPFSSLSPRSTVLTILREPLQIHNIGNSREQAEYAAELLRMVGLQPSFLFPVASASVLVLRGRLPCARIC